MNKNNKIYSIWLQQILGYASGKISLILNKFSSAENFYNSSYTEKLNSKILDKKILDKTKNISLSLAEKILKQCNELDINVISIEDKTYPKNLKEIYNPPTVIYTKGKKLNINQELSISVVGSRHSDEYGNEIAFELGCNLSKYGVNVISGGALGIDTMALKGAISAKNSNIICVVATGLNIYYPKSNKNLYKIIEKCGTMVSEFPPFVTARPGYFPIRNRIMSGISQGVVIVQAAVRSGAIITANLALEQGKEIFAIPGNINNIYSRGTNLLIKDGATPVTDVQDILEVYGLTKKIADKFIFDEDETKETEISCSLNAKKLYSVITKTPEIIDELAKKAKLDIINAQTAAMELLLIKAIKTHSGGRYSK